MKPKKGRIQFRTRQRMKRRTVILIAATCFTLIGISITLVINLTQVDNSLASQGTDAKVIVVEDQEFTTDKAIPEPKIILLKAPGPNTVFVRMAKPLNEDKTVGQ